MPKMGRYSSFRPGQTRKRKFRANRYTNEQERDFTRASARKLKKSDDDEIIIDATHGYRILHFVSVFAALSQMVICETCKKRMSFNETHNQGVGFRIVVLCECERRYIESSPRVNNKAYEINRQMVLVMRLLGVGREGLNLFCSLMDISSGFSSTLYNAALDNIHCAASAVFDFYVKKVVGEEKERNAAAGNPESHLTVSGDDSWKKWGFTSLVGVVTLTGKYSEKIIDLVVKYSYCKQCEKWKGKEDTEEYIEWFQTHKDECSVNHTGSAGKMEPDAIGKMFSRFSRFEERYKVKCLLEKCLGGNTQNSNESFNATVWQLVPKHQDCGQTIVEISAFLAASIFNVGYNAILKTFMTMGIRIGSTCKVYAKKKDKRRRSLAPKEVRTVRREDLYERTEGLLYSPGIAE